MIFYKPSSPTNVLSPYMSPSLLVDYPLSMGGGAGAIHYIHHLRNSDTGATDYK